MPSELTLGHEAGLPLLGLHDAALEATRKAKVADLELAVGVDKEVSGLEVAVEDVGRVDVLTSTKAGPWTHLQSAQRLVDEALEVGVRQRLAGADLGSAPRE